jgi:hypothetical protein
MLLLPAYLPPGGVTSSQPLLPVWPDGLYPLQIAVRDQQKALLQLNSVVNREQFYFAIDLIEEKIVHRNGLSRWLGFSDADFSVKDFLEIIHPHHAAVEEIYCRALVELLLFKPFPLDFMQTICTSTLALRNKKGQYHYVKRECVPFQLNHQGKLTAYICVFTLIKDFNREQYQTRIYHAGNTARSLDELPSLVRKIFNDLSLFSIQELRILKRYAQKTDLTSEQLGAAFKIKKSTVETFNKRILKKAASFSGHPFSTAKEAAIYFKTMGLI